MLTQKCRVIYEFHNRDIEEYRQRKVLYRDFETDELFMKNQPIVIPEKTNNETN